MDHKPTLNSIEYREHEKHNGADAKEIRMHQKFTPLVFSLTWVELARAEGWVVVQSGRTGPLLLCSCQYDFKLVLCWFCESVGPELMSKSGTVDPLGVEKTSSFKIPEF